EGKAAAPNVANVREDEFVELGADGKPTGDKRSARAPAAKKAPPKRASAKDDGVVEAPAAIADAPTVELVAEASTEAAAEENPTAE
ncbi:MAG: hypothetical protein ABJA62_10485, partial [Luteimonas sp.]